MSVKIPTVCYRLSMITKKRIALIAHDNQKASMVNWAREHVETLKHHQLFATGTTGGRLESELGLQIHRFIAARLEVISRSAPRSLSGQSTS